MGESLHLVDCPNCRAKVQGEERGTIWTNSNDEPEEAYIFLRCVVCGSPIVLWVAERYQCGFNEYDWAERKRVWPSIDDLNHPAVPNGVAKDLLDAKKCFDAGVYSACVVMCGRALEGIVREKCNEKNLSKGLMKLKEMEVIDQRLFNWSELLRNERNLGAHASGEEITRENARDLHDFVHAMCEFIYILADKYDSFLKRKTPTVSNP
jgi:hypothetical protein